jgi:hypothetical protein
MLRGSSGGNHFRSEDLMNDDNLNAQGKVDDDAHMAMA